MCGSSGIVCLDINAQHVFGQGGVIVMQFAERLISIKKNYSML